MKGHEFSAQLKHGKYTSVGCYPRFLIMSDGGTLCLDCAKAEAARIRLAAMCALRDGWRPEGFDINWEDPELFCNNCNQRIESAYAEDES